MLVVVLLSTWQLQVSSVEHSSQLSMLHASLPDLCRHHSAVAPEHQELVRSLVLLLQPARQPRLPHVGVGAARTPACLCTQLTHDADSFQHASHPFRVIKPCCN
jgi:hypothetical protein